VKQRIRTPQELGLLVRATRKASGLRADDTAGCAGVTHVFVRHVEHGKPTCQLGKVLELLDELGIHLTVDVSENVGLELQKLKDKGLRPLKPRGRPKLSEPAQSQEA
jgi:hypothetical protein